jgi:hypothetical protein
MRRAPSADVPKEEVAKGRGGGRRRIGPKATDQSENNMLMPTFEGLDPTMGPSKEARVIEVEADGGGYAAFDEGGDAGKSVMLKSRLKRGITVSTTLSRCQTQRVPLLRSDVARVDEIYATVSSLGSSHDATLQRLFGSPFSVTLTKTDMPAFGSSLSVSGSGNGERTDPLDRAGRSSSSRGGGEKEGQVGSGIKGKTVSDIANSVKMDAMTRQVIEKYWLPALRRMETYRVKYGVSPLYFVEVVESVGTYVVTGEEEREGDGANEHDEEGEEEEEEVAEAERQGEERGGEGGDRRGDGKRRISVPGARERRREGGGFEMARIVDERNDPAVGDRWGYPTHLAGREGVEAAVRGDDADVLDRRSQGYGGRRWRETTRGGERGKRGGLKIKRGEAAVLGPKDVGARAMGYRTHAGAAEALGLNLPDSTSERHIPNAGKVVLRDGNLAGDLADWGGLHDDLDGNRDGDLEEQIRHMIPGGGGVGRVAGFSAPSLGGTEYVNGTRLDVLERRRRVEESYKARFERMRARGKAKGRKYRELVETYRKEMRRDFGEDVSYDPGFGPEDSGSDLGSDDGGKRREGGRPESPPSRPRPRRNAKGSTKAGVKVRPAQTKATHQVPVVPPVGLGQIETYEDLKGPRYMWTWTTSDGFSGTVEPFMMWVLFSPPDPDGKLNSPVATMLNDYERYQMAERNYEAAMAASEIPLYAVSEAESKLGREGGGLLGGEHFAPFVSTLHQPGSAGGAASGRFGPGGSERLPGAGGSGRLATLELDEGVILSRSLDPFGGLPMRHRQCLPEDGPANGRPAWDRGHLVDRTSEGYRGWTPNVFEAQLRNAQLGLGPLRDLEGASGGWWGGPFGRPLGGEGEGGGGGWVAGVSRRATFQLNTKRPSSLAYERKATAAEYRNNVCAARSTESLLGQRVVHTPLGDVWYLGVNQSVSRLENGAKPDGERMRYYADRLERTGAAVGCSPGSIPSDSGSGKGAGPDGVFTTKTAAAPGTTYGLNVSTQMMGPTKEQRENNYRDLSDTYAGVVRQVFKAAYRHIFSSQEAWYRAILKETFASEVAASPRGSRRKVRREVPTLESLFTIDVTFPCRGFAGGLNQALDLYKIGYYDAEDAYVQFLASVPNSIRKTDLLNLITGNEERTGNGKWSKDQFRERVRRFKEGMDAAIQFEKDRAIKRDPVAATPEGEEKKPKPKDKRNLAEEKKKGKEKTKEKEGKGARPRAQSERDGERSGKGTKASTSAARKEKRKREPENEVARGSAGKKNKKGPGPNEP